MKVERVYKVCYASRDWRLYSIVASYDPFVLTYGIGRTTRSRLPNTPVMAFTLLSEALRFAEGMGRPWAILQGIGTPFEVTDAPVLSSDYLHWNDPRSQEEIINYWISVIDGRSLDRYHTTNAPLGTIMLWDFTGTRLVERWQ